MQALEWIRDYPFFQHALLTGVAVGTVCSLLSVLVVLKRMAFIGEGVAHAGFGGIGTAVFLGAGAASRSLLVLCFCLGTALLIGVLSRRRHVEPDSAIGILLVSAVAWGVFLSDLVQTEWYAANIGRNVVALNWESFLFGEILTISRSDMWLAMGLSAAVLTIFWAFFKEIVFFSFDESTSRVFGVRTGFVYYLLLGLLSVTIVMTVRLAGILLVTALLVIPGVTALQISRRLTRVMVWSWLVGMAGVVGGLLVCLQLGNLSPGPCIVGVLSLVFVAVFAGRLALGRGRPTTT